MSNVGHHALFVDSFNPLTNEIRCLNSWGPNNNPNPILPISSIKRFYRVSCSAHQISPTSTTTQQQLVNTAPQLQSNSRISLSVGTQQSNTLQFTADSSDDDDDFISEIIEKDLSHLNAIIGYWQLPGYYPHLDDVERAARLVQSGHLSTIGYMKLRNMNIGSISKKALGKLAAAVRNEIYLENVEGDLKPIFVHLKKINLSIRNLNSIDGTSIPENILAKEVYLTSMKGKGKDDLLTLFRSLQCRKLVLNDIKLGKKETKILVQLLYDHVEELELQSKVFLILPVFLQFDGLGACKSIISMGDTMQRYWHDELITWVKNVKYKAARPNKTTLQIKKI